MNPYESPQADEESPDNSTADDLLLGFVLSVHGLFPWALLALVLFRVPSLSPDSWYNGCDPELEVMYLAVAYVTWVLLYLPIGYLEWRLDGHR